MKRLLAAFCLVGSLAAVPVEAPSTILLIPLDDRPVCRQLPEQIAAMAGWQVVTPPRELLGGFDVPGEPDRILDWLEKQPEPKAVIVSLDMVGYGGLVASREGRNALPGAERRLKRLHGILDRWPKAKKSGFGTIMRVSLTSKPINRDWRDSFLRYVTLRSRGELTEARRSSLLKQIPSWAITEYDKAREEHHRLNMLSIFQVEAGEMDLLFGQDDAGVDGPHVPEVEALREQALRLPDGQVQVVQGVDQLASLLVSRTLIQASGKTPSVKVVWSNTSNLDRVQPYEAEPLRKAIEGQIQASGLRVDNVSPDGILAIEAPGSTRVETQRLVVQIEQGLALKRTVAAASADLGNNGVAGPALPSQLVSRGILPRLASFSAWNTASNSVGTAVSGLGAELAGGRQETQYQLSARRDHLFSRLLYDWVYHVELRPKIFQLTQEMGESRDRLTQSGRERMEPWLQNRMAEEAEWLLKQHIIPTAPHPQLWSLRTLRAELPWSRPFEVEIELEWR